MNTTSRYALVAASLLLSGPHLHAQWTRESPQPTALTVGGIAAPTPNRVFLATADDPFDNGGALFESSDAGSSWVQRDVPTDLFSGLHGIAFLDADHGWTWGNVNHRTVDGGDTWAELPLLGSTYAMTFVSPSIGLATGNFGRALTLDGGLTWEAAPFDIFGLDLRQPVALGVAATGVYRSADSAGTFALVLEGDAKEVAFLSNDVAIAIVNDALWRTGDAGLTWAEVGAAAGRTRLAALSETVVLATGRSGSLPDFDDRMFRSDDGGLTWADLGEPVAPEFFTTGIEITPIDATTAIAADGSGNLYRTVDAGATWVQVFASPGPTPSFLGSTRVVFPDAVTGFYAFGPGLIIASSDGGVTWTQRSSGSGSSLDDVARFADGRQLAVGVGGTILTRAAGSSQWVLQAPPSTEDLVAIEIIGPTSALVVGDSGQLYLTGDGGHSWSATGTVPPNFSAFDLSFSDANNGLVAGAGVVGVYATSDGGASWTPVAQPGGWVVAVERQGDHIWCLRDDGILWSSANAGSTWTMSSLPGTPNLMRELVFVDNTTGFAFGGGGYAVRTTDGGLQWTVLPTPDVDDVFTGAFATSASEVWLVTTEGRLLYSATAGDHWAAIAPPDARFFQFSAVVGDGATAAWITGAQGDLWRFDGPPPPPLNQLPHPGFQFVATGLSVAFTDTSTDADGTVVGWAWDFGDGSSATEQSPTHVFGGADTYIVRLTVTDDDGGSASVVRFVTVQPGPGGTFGEFTEVTPPDPLFVTPQNEDFWVSAAAGADFDHDGDLDLAVLGYYVVYNQSVDERLVLFRNDGPSGPERWSLTPIDLELGTLVAGASDVSWADVDGDGDDDLLVASYGEATLYRNQGGTLVPTDTVLPAYWEDNDQADFDLVSLSWADYDNDGDADLLVPSVWDSTAFQYRTLLLRNDGENGTGGVVFTDIGAALAGTSHAQSFWADFDHDLDLDLLLVNLAPLTDGGFIRRYRNDGDGTFTPEDILGELKVEHGEVQWGDYDADGDLDVLVAGHIQELDGSFAVVLRIYRNDAETYVPVEVIPCPACDGWFDITAASWGDYDSDGDIDILLAGTYNSGSNIEGRARVYTNDAGVFTDPGSQLPAPRASGSRGGAFTWMDLDGDADLDYFIAGQYFVPGGNGLVEAQMHVYRNDTLSANQAPQPPTQLGATVALDGVVSLFWSPGTDDTTPTVALTYELGLARNGQPITLSRHKPQAGNLGATAGWSLEGLPNGLYSWSVEAIDSAFNSSSRVSHSFRVGPEPQPIFSDGFETGTLSAWSASTP